MTKFYESMPAELPKTLPAGTRISNGWVFIGEAKLDNCVSKGAAYGDCDVRYDNGVARGSSRVCLARQVVWAEVPLPTQEPVVPCAACGGPGGYAVRRDGIGLLIDGDEHGSAGHLLCVTCWCKPAGTNDDAIRARRAAQGSSGSGDGIEPDCRCGHAGCSRCDKPPVATFEPGDPRGERYCPECGVTVVAGPDHEFPLCGKCVERRSKGYVVLPGTTCSECKAPCFKLIENGLCVYCHESMGGSLLQDRVVRDASIAKSSADIYRESWAAAAARMAKMDRAERPRHNPAEAKELAKPHPWDEFE